MSSDLQQSSPVLESVPDVQDGSIDLTTPSETHAHIESFSYHDNDVNMSFNVGDYKLVKGAFTISDYSITNGQDPDHKIQNGQTYTYSGNDGKMTFRVGRKGSEQVANWWNGVIPASKNTFGHSAGDLNFGFVGKLQITLTGGALGGAQETFTLDDVGIAQGHVGASNNWWFGGKNAEHLGGDVNSVRVPGHSSRGTWHFDFQRGYPSLAQQLVIVIKLSTS